MIACTIRLMNAGIDPWVAVNRRTDVLVNDGVVSFKIQMDNIELSQEK